MQEKAGHAVYCMNFEKLKLLFKEGETERGKISKITGEQDTQSEGCRQCLQLALHDLDQLKINFYLNGIGFALHLGVVSFFFSFLIGIFHFKENFSKLL